MHTEIQSTSIHQTLLCKDTKCLEPSGAVNETIILFSLQSHSTLHEHTQTAIGKWLMGHSKKTVLRGISSGSWVWNKTTSVGLNELAGGFDPSGWPLLTGFSVHNRLVAFKSGQSHHGLLWAMTQPLRGIYFRQTRVSLHEPGRFWCCGISF